MQGSTFTQQDEQAGVFTASNEAVYIMCPGAQDERAQPQTWSLHLLASSP